jgi:hypothetical protein
MSGEQQAEEDYSAVMPGRMARDDAKQRQALPAVALCLLPGACF